MVCAWGDGADAGRDQPGLFERGMESLQYPVCVPAGLSGVYDRVFFKNRDRHGLLCIAGKGYLQRKICAVQRDRVGGGALLWDPSAVPGVWDRLCVHSAGGADPAENLFRRGKALVCSAVCLSVFIVFFLFRIFYPRLSCVRGDHFIRPG